MAKLSRNDRYKANLQRFLQSQDAIRELVVFCQENVSSLDESAFITRAAVKRRLLGVTPEEADAAHRLLKDHFEGMKQKAAENAGTQDANRSERAALRIIELFAELEKIAPGRDPLSLLLAHIDTLNRRPRLPLIMSSLLISMVSDFEVLFGRMVKHFFKTRPEALITSEKNLSWADLQGYETLDEFRDHYIDQQVERLLRDSFDDWMQWLQKKLNINASDIIPNLNDTREIFQRRHIAVHNEGRVSRQYLIKLPHLTNPPEIGIGLPIDSAYMLHAMDQLAITAIGITVSVMRRTSKKAEDSESVDSMVSNLSYELLRDRRDYAVDKICAMAINDMADEYARLVLQVNSWIARRRLGGVEAISDEIDRWKTGQLADRFKLAKLALLGNNSEAYTMAQRMLKAEELTQGEWREWPLLEEVRSYAEHL